MHVRIRAVLTALSLYHIFILTYDLHKVQFLLFGIQNCQSEFSVPIYSSI